MATSMNLPRSAPEAQGIPSSCVLEFVDEIRKQVNSLHSFMLLRCGIVVAEGWWRPYRPESPHMLFSLSKSFTSTAVGLAVAEGLLSVNDPVLKFFPEDAPKKVSQNLAAMQVHHLLSMSTGHDQDTTERTMRSRNPFKGFLGLRVEHEPGTHFVYNSGASFMLAAIVQKLTGQTVCEYLTPRLFGPLGIRDVYWESHPNGVNFGGWGLNLKTEDIARFGQLYLQNGVWDNQQLIPAAWVQAATSKQVSNGSDPNSDWTQGYGYQFWRCRHNIYRGDGAFGQYCIVMPDQNAVLALTGGLPDMQVVLNVVWDKLLPGLQAGSLLGDGQPDLQLSRSLAVLESPSQQGASHSPLGESLSGKVFTFEPNEETLHLLAFDFKTNTITYRLMAGGRRRGIHTLSFGVGKWVDGVTALGAPAPMKAAASGAWIADDTFVLAICAYETPFTISYTCRFEDDKLHCAVKTNVAFGPTERKPLLGIQTDSATLIKP
ncbi:MAG: class C beta-lactamase-related serine hydrolase [Chloroflexota bacterium]|nr:MAG: class C beta-lactamase-related serine hydrolase [Chloroflexota bacterium]